MKAVIVEDEAIASRRLRHLIEELAPECEILTQISSVESGLKWFAENDFKVVTCILINKMEHNTIINSYTYCG